ncbi:MAG: VacJ family lipoprotein [Geminicoccaceae bacterium]|nr:VacJ family lipoprotein [Geminicoccaceae bacterium]
MRNAACAAALALGLGGCATAAADGDPFEPVNRAVFAFNQTADRYVIAPVARAYGHYVPEVAKQGARNVFSNLGEPFTFVNDVLQGEPDRAGETFSRFFVNSTLGLFGLFDMASMMKVAEAHDEDFGQTLAVWGVGDGPYLVLPILGPSNLRDAGGRVVGYATNPASALAGDVVGSGVGAGYAPTSLVYGGVDTRWQLDPLFTDVEKNSLDPYTTFRTTYQQNRAKEIRNGAEAPPNSSYEDIFEDTK